MLVQLTPRRLAKACAPGGHVHGAGSIPPSTDPGLRLNAHQQFATSPMGGSERDQGLRLDDQFVVEVLPICRQHGPVTLQGLIRRGRVLGAARRHVIAPSSGFLRVRRVGWTPQGVFRAPVVAAARNRFVLGDHRFAKNFCGSFRNGDFAARDVLHTRQNTRTACNLDRAQCLFELWRILPVVKTLGRLARRLPLSAAECLDEIHDLAYAVLFAHLSAHALSSSRHRASAFGEVADASANEVTEGCRRCAAQRWTFQAHATILDALGPIVLISPDRCHDARSSRVQTRRHCASAAVVDTYAASREEPIVRNAAPPLDKEDVLLGPGAQSGIRNPCQPQIGVTALNDAPHACLSERLDGQPCQHVLGAAAHGTPTDICKAIPRIASHEFREGVRDWETALLRDVTPSQEAAWLLNALMVIPAARAEQRAPRADHGPCYGIEHAEDVCASDEHPVHLVDSREVRSLIEWDGILPSHAVAHFRHPACRTLGERHEAWDSLSGGERHRSEANAWALVQPTRHVRFDGAPDVEQYHCGPKLGHANNDRLQTAPFVVLLRHHGVDCQARGELTP
mmetsp:Transcript_47045/g.131134  ORF Transcript_47045/g.131134 Transcript_47045/m.131134 type:complete len:568 (-) Transcript_47045:381-2084(-)